MANTKSEKSTDSHVGMMGDGTEEQNLNQPGDPAARISEDEVAKAFGKSRAADQPLHERMERRPDMTRFGALDVDRLTPEQKVVYDRIANGPREGVRGPLAVWLKAPEFADLAEALGRYCRFDNTLGPRLRELAILITVAHWGAQFAWHRHVPLALQAGVSHTVIEDIRSGFTPTFENECDAIAHAFLRELLEKRAVEAQTFEKARVAFGESGVVDLIGVSGYYGLVAMTINAAALGADEEHLRPDA